MEETKSLMSCSIDKTIKLWNLSASTLEPQSISADGPVQHMSVKSNILFYANDVIPGGGPTGDTVGIVQMLNLGSNVNAKCLVMHYLLSVIYCLIHGCGSVQKPCLIHTPCLW